MSDSMIKQAQSIGFDLDGVSVVAREGESILKAAQRAGHDIPHLCYSDGLRADGNCRACVVEIEGERALAPSCCRQPTEGMVVYSNNARARQSQALVLELLKTDVGDAKFTGTSELDQWCDRLNIGPSRFASRNQPMADVSHPAIEVNLEACIQCTRCLRACREEQANDVIGFACLLYTSPSPRDS